MAVFYSAQDFARALWRCCLRAGYGPGLGVHTGTIHAGPGAGLCAADGTVAQSGR